MENDNATLAAIISEFPEKQKEIKTLFSQSTGFIEVCEDYVLCKNSIKIIEATGKENLIKNLEDLKLALEELKEELWSNINKTDIQCKDS